jgi:hypothetical protein
MQTVMTRRSLPEDCVLERTAEGTRRMRDRSAGLPARLRSVLFVVDGAQPVARILGKAGQLRPLLEDQLVELMDMGLVVGIGGQPMELRPQAPVPAVRVAPPRPMGNAPVVPIIGAKVQLLDCLERVSGGRMKQEGSTLVEARTWKDLASRARSLSAAIQDCAGPEAAARFWTEAKEILVTFRGQDAEARP